MLYVCVRRVMYVVFFCLYMYCCAWSRRCSCMGNMSVSSCICCMFVSCVHAVAVLFQFVNADRGCKRRPYGREEAYSRAGLMTAL